MKLKTSLLGFSAAAVLATSAFAAAHMQLAVMGQDQSVNAGAIVVTQAVSANRSWLVVHRTGDDMKPGPVIGHAPLQKGENPNLVVTLDEAVTPGQKLMLMLHGEEGGMQPGVFEYYLGAKEDGPVKVDGKLVMDVITIK